MVSICLITDTSDFKAESVNLILRKFCFKDQNF